MEDNYLMVKEKLKKYGQEHLLNFYNKLDEGKQEQFLEDILNIDFEEIKSLYNNIQNDSKNAEDKIEAIGYVNKEKISLDEQKHYMEIGEKVIKQGQYAVVTMAGGQRN